jgi:hypothetical protein
VSLPPPIAIAIAIAMVHCLGCRCPDQWLRPVLDQFQHELAVDDFEATRLELLPVRRDANRHRGQP